jgi:hypothetical protein
MTAMIANPTIAVRTVTVEETSCSPIKPPMKR